MISHRVMFVVIPLFLSMIIIISTAPILNKQLVTEVLGNVSTNEINTTIEPINYEDDKSESDEESDESTTVEYTKETTPIPEMVTSGLLYVNGTDISLDINTIIKIIDPFLSETEPELPATPTTESPEASQPYTSNYQ